MKEKKNNKLPFFKIFFRIAPMVYKVFPISYIIFCLIAIAHGMSWAVAVFANQTLYDALASAVFSSAPTSKVIWAGVLVAAITVGCQVLNGVHNFLFGIFWRKATGRLVENIHMKSGMLSAAVFEDKNRLDDINKANEGMNNAVGLFMGFFNLFTFYLPYFGFLFFYLYSIKPLLTFSFIIVFIPVFVSQIVRAKLYAKLEDESAPLRREYEHYEQCLCGQEFMKETRLLGAYKYFMRRYMETITLLTGKQWRIEKKIGLINVALNALTLIGYIGILFMLFTAMMDGEISVGSFAAVYSSVGMMFGVMDEIFRNNLSSFTKNLGAINNFIHFLDLPVLEGDKTPPDHTKGVVADNISFTYPLAEKPSVKNVSLKIRDGETIAIVGENGSGKSTLVKLLTGLYQPSEGVVTIGDADTRATSHEALYSDISAVFQTYQRYKLELSENVGVSDMAEEGPVEERVIEALKKTDVDASDEKTFPNGLQTVLSREFEGVDLSGGQWQRVAIARGLYRNHRFIALDEPTAAIDPIEETNIYKKFADISRDITAIIVTHRLGSARIAERIVVMDGGEIKEMGSHEELVKRGGKYAEMWSAQTRYYV